MLNEVQALALRRKTENYPEKMNTEAVYGLIRRVFGENYAQVFVLETTAFDGIDRFSLEDTLVDGQQKILLRASSGIAAAGALRWYLQERCGSYIGPITRRLNLPEQPPRIGGSYENESPFLYRYFFNYCTFGYTCLFWSWEEWEPFLDWLVLSGYNLILNPLGNERVWTNTLQRLGYTLADARKFLCSPAFYPWQCMLNLTEWGGAAPEPFYDDRVELSRKLTARLKELGANVVLPGYCGAVPNDIGEHFPDAEVLDQGGWCGFKRPALLLHGDPLFTRIARIYYEEQKKVLGNCTSYFSVDPFHEGGRTGNVDLTAYGLACYKEMLEVSPTAVWVLQGWQDNPKRSILSAMPTEGVLIVNLRSETNVNGGDNFANRPWIYGCVNNFGGVRTLRARLNRQFAGPHGALSDENNTMVGIGILPEGVEVDECGFDIFSDIAFLRELPPISQWQTEYLRHRYGVSTPALERAWDALRRDIYLSDTSSTPRGSALASQPSLTVAMYTPSCASKAHTYHPKLLIPIAKDLLEEKDRLNGCAQYRFDIAEVLRQLVALTSWGVAEQLQDAYRAVDVEGFEAAVSDFMSLFDFQCKVMADSPALTLGQRLAMAERHGRTPAEKLYFTYQQKTLITTWGDRVAFESLHDYSTREWSGMLEHFHRPRWERYINYLRLELMCPRLEKDADRDYPQFDTDRAFCLSNTDVADVTPSENLAYAPALLDFCGKLLDQQQIDLPDEAQEHSMECG